MDPPFDLNYYFSTLFLDAARRPLVANYPPSLRSYNEKLAILLFPDLIAPTLISSDIDQIRAFVGQQGRAVLKPLDSCSGRGVLKLSPKDTEVIAEATQQGQKPVMVQRFLEEVHAGETRLTLLGGEPLGWMKKIPRSDSFLANFDLGATGHPHEPSEAELNCAQRLKPFMQENRLYFTAIDIIGGNISEINLTSPGLVRQTNEAMGEKLEVRMQDFYEETYRRHAERLR
jgi:glutathione synthase